MVLAPLMVVACGDSEQGGGLVEELPDTRDLLFPDITATNVVDTVTADSGQRDTGGEATTPPEADSVADTQEIVDGVDGGDGGDTADAEADTAPHIEACEGPVSGSCPLSNVHGTCAGQRVCVDHVVACQGDPPTAERCDDLDNNCNGHTNEGFEGRGEPCGTGACKGGLRVCTEDGAELICTTDGLQTAERCDGVDNDCDGETDEDFAVGAPCDSGTCANSVQVCTEDGLGTTCSSGGAELCDGLDNTCDGHIDEGFVLGEPCGTGACKDGVSICAPGGQAVTCSTAELSSADICDGIDNDCDGESDEDYEVGTPCGSGACDGGVTTCRQDGLGTTCTTAGNARPERCDGVDNNCNGEVDEGYANLGQGCGQGACRGGTIACTADGLGTECATAHLSETERCDGEDNDCDGLTDEDYDVGNSCATADCPGGVRVCNGAQDGTVCTAGSGAGPELCDGIDNNCNGAIDEGFPLGEACGTGSCEGGVRVCASSKQTTACSTAEFAQPERCDTLDNDCDGQTDEGFGELGGSCGTGACEDGTIICSADGMDVRCSTDQLADSEVCDGRDNDCDGFTDEGFADLGAACGLGVCAGGEIVCRGDGLGTVCDTEHLAQASDRCDDEDDDCDGHTDEDFPDVDTACGTGACAGGIRICDASGDRTTCSTASVASGEVCNREDDDCDGFTDEDFGGLGDSCGQGDCAGGEVVCAEGGAGTVCSTVDDGGDEVCDGDDNDCDGLTDEDFTDLGVPCGMGACAGGAMICAADGMGTVCSNSGGDSDPCDGEDNDCDGATDEDFVAAACIVPSPFGDCDGLEVCNASGLHCLGRAAERERCNTFDDDCDGAIDEGFTYKGSAVGALCDGEGACGAGQVECAPPSSEAATTCSSNPDGSASEARSETCDGADNDCDGLTDENWNGRCCPALGTVCPTGFMCTRDGTCESADGSGQVYVPYGSFHMGCAAQSLCPLQSGPGRRVTVPAFKIDKSEVTVDAYAACVQAGACTAPSWGSGCNSSVLGRGSHPVNCVDWNQARTYCQWRGMDLPTEAEWEKAARGGCAVTDGDCDANARTYPWGHDAATCARAIMNDPNVLYESTPEGCGQGRTWPAGSKPAGNSVYGVADMSGNVWEWVLDCWHDTYDGAPSDGSGWDVTSCTSGPPVAGALSEPGRRVARGGGWRTQAFDKSAIHRQGFLPATQSDTGGFRCAEPGCPPPCDISVE